MKKIDMTTGEINETPEKKELTAKEKNRNAQFERLLQASAEARAIREMMINTAKSIEQAMFFEGQPLNYFILKYVYAPAEEGTTDFKKFNEWKNEGYTIKKGSKAFPVWSQPTKREKKEEDGETAPAPTPALMENADGSENGGTRHERERFNMCYLFSNLQVTRREPAASDDGEPEPAAMVAAAVMTAAPEPINIF